MARPRDVGTNANGIVADGAGRLERELAAAAARAERLERRYRHLVRRAGVLTELGGRLADRFERELERIEREAPPELRERLRELLY